MNATSIYTDNELFLQVAEGNEAAFETLFHRFVPKIQPVMMGIVQSEAVVKDLVQDIFLNIWMNRYKLPDIETPSDWIFRIVYNRSYTWLEQQAVRRKVHQRIGAAQQLVLSNGQTEENVLFAETARLVQQAIHALPPQTKKIYLLSREEGLKNQEIADNMHLSVQTIKNTLVNAGKSIKEHLEKQGVNLPLALLAFYFV